MNLSGIFERPRLLVALTLAFAFVPAWLALVTYRDGRQKDERLFETSAQILSTQLRNSSDRCDYFTTLLRDKARQSSDASLTHGGLATAVSNWKQLFPFVISFGFAQQTNDALIVRWKNSEAVPEVRMGEDLMRDEQVRQALLAAHKKNRGAHIGIVDDHKRLMILSEVLTTGAVTVTRGYVATWIDLNALCLDAATPQIRDRILTAVPLTESSPLQDGMHRLLIDSDVDWAAGIARGANFNQAYGAPTPWIAFVAAGLSAVPLLLLAALAGRASRLKTELAAEREVVAQQRFFTQSVSHEFRTPLGIIVSGTELLDSYADRLTTERRSEVIAEIKDSAMRMNEMIEGVLLLGRIESSRIACRPVRVAVGELCREAARKVSTAVHAGREIVLSVPEGEALLDASLISSMLGNLLSNALKYSAADSPVSLEVQMDAAELVFTVRDKGVGIPADDQPQLCTPFHRGRNTGEVPGSGLGLAIVQRCATLHGGTLKFKSEVGVGTVATVTIPFL